ncbi:MAG TPA: M14 metallopeptidase family protein, partial [Planctomycetota bacterium]|nr:M14 metallopeptidase family protein [Planctomycetota bacterium]
MKPAAAPFLAPFAVIAALATGQQPFELQPGTQFDPAVPTLQATVGYAIGEEVSLHGEVERYLQALVKAAPERARLVEYGRTWQGRALYYLVIGSAANIARLPAIQAGMQKLADPRRLRPGEVEPLLADLPAVAWFAYCVHGDEPSGTDACLQVAYHLLASKDDAVVRAVLANCVVILDPLENPDGRDRFVHGTRGARGRWADAEPESAEHTQPWPGGRVNHYLFDMNRDWFGLSQPETRGRVRAFQQWWPLCYVDLHEMGGDSTYYFSPPSPPLNPEITANQRDWLVRYGRNNAAWFDRFGFDYFTREEFDSFYPGYGEGWPTFQGSIGMTFEQASARGVVFRRRDESLLHYRECVRHHFVATLGTLETLAAGRRDALAAFLAYRQSAIQEGQAGPEREYLFPDRGDRTRLARLMNLLGEQGIEVQRATAELRCGKARPYLGGEAKEETFPTGSYVVSLAQPGKRLATVLLHRQFEMDSKWLEEQRQREKKRLEPEFYDLTAWSLPLLFDVETWIAEDTSAGPRQTLAPGAASPVVA